MMAARAGAAAATAAATAAAAAAAAACGGSAGSSSLAPFLSCLMRHMATCSSTAWTEPGAVEQQQQEHQQQQHKQQPAGLLPPLLQQQQQQHWPALSQRHQQLQPPPPAWRRLLHSHASLLAAQAPLLQLQRQQHQQHQQPAAALAAAAGAHQLQQRRGMARPVVPYALTPKPLPRYRKPGRDGRINRAVVRVPPQVAVELRGDELRLTGKAGSTVLRLSHLDPTGLVGWQCYTSRGGGGGGDGHTTTSGDAAAAGAGSLLLLVSPSKRCWRGIQTHVENAVHGVVQGYLVGLTVQGVGYRMEPVSDAALAAALAERTGTPPPGLLLPGAAGAGGGEQQQQQQQQQEEEQEAEASVAAYVAAAAAGGGRPAPGSVDGPRWRQRVLWEAEAEKATVAYPHKAPVRAVRLKVGYTRAAIFPLPEGVAGFCVKPNLLYLYGVDKARVTNAAAAIRAVRKPNAYTGNGVQLLGEAPRLKQRAGSK